MEYIHCLQCYTRLGSSIKLAMTNCGHIFCKNCAPCSQLPKCLHCSIKNVQLVTIEKEMPGEILNYFKPNLLEEQKLLIRKYEFQLFQFKHLFKHVINDERKYKKVASEINKRLEEFKKCALLMQFPSSALLNRNAISTKNKTPSNLNQEITSPTHSRTFSQRTPSRISQPINMEKRHVKRLPSLPSPSGVGFSDAIKNSSRSSIHSTSSVNKTQQNINHHNQLKLLQQTLPRADSSLNRQMSRSNSSLASNRSNYSNASYTPRQTNNRNPRSTEFHRSSAEVRNQPSPIGIRYKESSKTPLQYPIQSPTAIHKVSSQNQMSFGQHREGEYLAKSHITANRQRRDSISSLTSNGSNIFNPQYSPMQSDNRNSQNRGLERSSQSIFPTLQDTKNQLNYTYLSLKSDSQKLINQRSLDLNNARNNISRQSMTQISKSTPNRNPMSQNDIPKTNEYKGAQKDQSSLCLPISQKAYLSQIHNNDSRRPSRCDSHNIRNHNDIEKEERNGLIQHTFSQIRSHHDSNSKRKPCQPTPIDYKYNNSPFVKYRIQPQSTPGTNSLATPLNSGQSHLSNNQTPSSAERTYNKTKREQPYRLVSPKTSNSLSSSATNTHKEMPYKRPSPGVQNSISELRTPRNSPINKQQLTPPFLETLKLLTLAVKENKR